MTHNQIAYWQAVETARSNQVREREASRHNRRTESQTDAQNLEAKRHNLAGERNSANITAESIRHNRAMEYETGRHNLADEANKSSNVALGYSNLREVSRHNLAQEHLSNKSTMESVRHNQEQERISNAANQISAGNLQARLGELSETSTHNRQMELLNATSQIFKGADSLLQAAKGGKF